MKGTGYNEIVTLVRKGWMLLLANESSNIMFYLELWPNMFPRSSLAIIFRSDHTSHDGHQHIHVPTHDYHVGVNCSWAWLRPSSNPNFLFDLNYTPFKFHDCILQGCEVISRLSTDKHLAQNCFLWQVVLQQVSPGSQFAMMTHKQTQKLNTLPFDTAVAEK